MGSDYHLNPPPPLPLWEQVKRVVEQSKEKSETISVMRQEIKELKQHIASQDRVIARQAVELQGQTFKGEE